MAVLSTIGFILLFIVCISVLIIVHELGHLATAKLFKVYCLEFSCGMGPAIIHKKKKGGETYFSLRAIPFGGYVSMYDKGVELPDGVVVDQSRCFSFIAKWKRVIILFAGVFNNAILAIIIFLVSESCFEQKQMYLNYVDVASGSIAEKAGIKNPDTIKVSTTKSGEVSYYTLDTNAIAHYSDKQSKIAVVLSTNISSYDKRSFDDYISYHLVSADGLILGNAIEAKEANLQNITYSVSTTEGQFFVYVNSTWVKQEIAGKPIENPTTGNVYMNEDGKFFVWDATKWVEKNYTSKTTYPTDAKELDLFYNPEFVITPHAVSVNVIAENNGNCKFENLGLSFHLETYWNNFGTAVKNTFVDFGQSATAIAKSIASLFYSRETWGQIGGIVSIGVQTSSILQNMGWAKFLYVWGLISVNLAIVNLLPFPGLDGWQILVIIVEAVAHREIPDKVKNIMSTIGLILLFAFMIIILCKDIVGLF